MPSSLDENEPVLDYMNWSEYWRDHLTALDKTNHDIIEQASENLSPRLSSSGSFYEPLI